MKYNSLCIAFYIYCIVALHYIMHPKITALHERIRLLHPLASEPNSRTQLTQQRYKSLVYHNISVRN